MRNYIDVFTRLHGFPRSREWFSFYPHSRERGNPWGYELALKFIWH